MSTEDLPRPPSFASAPRRTGAPEGDIEVHVADEQDEVDVDVERLAGLAHSSLVSEGVRGDVELGVLVVDEPTMADLNLQHMGEHGPTDVLAFPIGDEYIAAGRNPEAGPRGPTTREPLSTPGPLLLGDVVLCPAVARRNAPLHAGSFPGHVGELTDELDLLVVHGMLHVLGHDHATDEEREAMRAKERELLSAYRDRHPPPGGSRS